MNKFTTRPEIVGNFGIVTSTHWIASAVGMSVLEKGGNAFDAAISVAFALAVVNPSAGNIGGGGFALLYDANKKTIESIDYRERAPIKARENMFLDENGVPFTGGTYFPPKEMHGRPSFINILNQVSEFYEKNRDKILNSISKAQEKEYTRESKFIIYFIQSIKLIYKDPIDMQ